MSFDPTKPYRLDPRVALRPEPFGALAYHYGNRRLTLLRAPELVALVSDIDRYPSARAAYDGTGIDGRRWGSFAKALTSLERSGFLAQSDGRPAGTPDGSTGGSVRPTAAGPEFPSWIDPTLEAPPTRGTTMADQLKAGLNAPICLTWEWTYACNLQCVHCLSSSGTRDPNELSTAEMKAIVDDLRRLGVFYVNIGGGEPMLRPDFFEVVEYCVSQGVGVKFSTNGGLLTAAKAERLAGMDYVDVQISLDGI
ncbi:MAG: mycofactocin biosynthesis chaperone MftB, partial [Acidimicrobiales bacterium]